MNSSDLFRGCSSTYYDFFGNCSTVMSLPGTSGIFGGTACIYGGLISEYKLPLRIYVGIERTTAPLSLGEYYQYIPKTERFEIINTQDSFVVPDEQFITELTCLFPDFRGKIRILSEVSWKMTDAVSLLTLLCIEKELGITTDVMIEALAKTPVSKLGDDPIFSDLIHKTTRLRVHFNAETKGRSSMSSIFASVSNGVLPTAHMSEENIPLVSKDDLIASNPTKRKYFSKSLSEFSVLQSNDMPFDALIFHIWDIKNRYWSGMMTKWMSDASHMLKRKDIQEALQDGNFVVGNPEWDTDNIDLITSVITAINAHSFATLSALRAAIDAEIPTRELFFFIERNYESIKTFLGKSNLSYDQRSAYIVESIPALITSIFPGITRSDFAIYLTGISINLDIAVFLPKDSPKLSQEYIKQKIESQFWPESPVSYFFYSANDAYGIQWIRQDSIASFSVWSHAKDTYSLLDIFSKKMHYGTQAELLQKFWKTSIIADEDRGVIHAGWEEVNAKMLFSQNFTITLFKTIAESADFVVASTDLPVSSYAKSRSEFTGKILAPLKKIFAQVTGNDLYIECVGSQDFQIRFQKQETLGGIYLLKRIQKPRA